MDKRKYQRVVLIIGLLFLTIITCSMILFHKNSQLQEEKYRIIGQLYTKYPEMEQELIASFENKGDDIVGNSTEEDRTEEADNSVEDKTDQADNSKENKTTKDKTEEDQTVGEDSSGVYVAAGRTLEEKYGYTDVNISMMRDNVKYIVLILIILLLTTVLIGVILFYYERKQQLRNQEEEKTREQLREAKEAKQVLFEKLALEEKKTKELITDISHQLKTPLTSLKMSFEIAQSNDFTTEERSSFLLQGREEINKLQSLLEALLNMARLETNMIQMKPIKFSLKKTLTAAVNSIYMKAFDKKIEIEVEEFEDFIVLHDSKWTQEAFINVLDNAVKYSNPNTTVRIKVSALVNYIMIEIADEGIGIPIKEYPNIFKRFYRGHDEMVQKVEGSGVGLYLVRKILEEQGGSVCVKQGISCGSIFQMILPKA